MVSFTASHQRLVNKIICNHHLDLMLHDIFVFNCNNLVSIIIISIMNIIFLRTNQIYQAENAAQIHILTFIFNNSIITFRTHSTYQAEEGSTQCECEADFWGMAWWHWFTLSQLQGFYLLQINKITPLYSWSLLFSYHYTWYNLCNFRKFEYKYNHFRIFSYICYY